MAAENGEMKTSRLEAFSDGVIAVIITIMVLELHVPHQDGLAGLWTVAPRLGIYLLSFLTVGIYWINHHELLRRTEQADHRMLWANLIFLFALSLIPYFVDYLDDKQFSPFSTLLYEVVMLLAGFTFYILRRTVLEMQAQTGALTIGDRNEFWKHRLSLFLYVVSIAVSFYKPWISLALNLVVTLIWIVPQMGVQECHVDGADLSLRPEDEAELLPTRDRLK
ncbi:TMEM175 family protein [Silvibacterium sp.]|uniref:TMEM175 family protein n=1 Tax=Silvibacterium sp. TaxID=1964179 RepID=UPI0039E31C12